jgi:uncharacterized radical SAM protein YgiQ
MAELQLDRVARLMASGVPIRGVTYVPGTCWKTHDVSDIPSGFAELPSFDTVKSDKNKFGEAFKIFYEEQNFAAGRVVAQDQGSWVVVQNPPPPPMSQAQLDKIYELPYTRRPHPVYGELKIPALEEVAFSITSHRGCFGECAFCAITLHQGRVVQARGKEGILKEVRMLTREPDFKGYIHDIGGPTANFRKPSCPGSVKNGACKGKSCLFPAPCKELRASHREYADLLRSAASIEGVKKVFVRSGLRIDYILADPEGRDFLEELCRNHVSGQLKIAPEHADRNVLKSMRKSPPEIAKKFIKLFREINAALGKKQFLTPYFMSSHPGCGLKEASNLANFMKDEHLRPEQAQEFTPTPGTLATCMYYTGIDPFTGKTVHVARDSQERAMQRALLQYWMPHNRELVKKALALIENNPKEPALDNE